MHGQLPPIDLLSMSAAPDHAPRIRDAEHFWQRCRMMRIIACPRGREWAGRLLELNAAHFGEADLGGFHPAGDDAERALQDFGSEAGIAFAARLEGGAVQAEGRGLLAGA